MNPESSNSWQKVHAVIVPGHRVASGLNNDPRFPGGTLRMQAPHFRARGLDVEAFHLATVNVSIAPLRYQTRESRFTFRNVKWHPTEPAEDFSFFDCRVARGDGPPVAGLIYYPHPDTKPEHFQKPDVLELLLPWLEGLRYGESIDLEVSAEQMIFESTAP